MQQLRAAMAALVLGAAAAGASATPAVITNGGFDSQVGASAGTRYSTTNVSGWTVEAGNVDLVKQGGDLGGSSQLAMLMSQPSTSGLALDLNGNTFATISQTLNTVAGQQYTVSFDYAANPGTGNNSTASFNVLVFDAANDLFTAAVIGQASGWQHYTATFTATGATTISFESMQTRRNTTYGALLDNVAVTAVPEPAEYAMMIAGLAVVGGIARRRRAA